MHGSWWQTDPLVPAGTSREPLPGDRDADVAIVGAGYTGLWTAYHLVRERPGLRVVVLEREHVGFGASGRNGGWCSAIMPVALDALDARHGPGAGAAMQRTMIDTVHRIGSFCAEEGVDAHVEQGGWICLARTRAQVARLQESVAEARRHGFGEDHLRWLGPDDATRCLAASDVLGATYTPDCAAVHPLRLVQGLAQAAERRGVVVHEATPVLELGPGAVRTTRGTVRAPFVLRATEAYTRDLPGRRRELLPVYSLMIATEPIDDHLWADIGLAGRPTFSDGRRMVIYGQRTADGRIAFGGRGAPYHFGSAVQPAFDRDEAVRASLVATLRDLLPQLRDVPITHHWGGPLGVPRDWHPFVRLDRATGLGEAGGYVGDGVATSHLAGRTLADLVLEQETEATRLAWVGHRARRWEPEPVRWTAVNGAMRLTEAIDRRDAAGRASRWRSAVLDRLTGH